MYKVALLIMLGFGGVVLSGQESLVPADFCGSNQGRPKWLQQYQQSPESFRKGGDTTLYVAMTVHLLGTDEGAAYYSENTLLDAFCKLNESFAPAGIQFFLAGDVLYHNNSAYYRHATVLEGAEMMFTYNVPNTLNTYFVSDPAGNCGYNLPYAGIANRISCSGADDITWAHEVGHWLSLPHPFFGLEGGINWDDTTPPNFADPAPERVTADYTFFQDILILDTLIIDTVFVERTDGSNCSFAADGFCDTNPDYLASRWNCNGAGVSAVVQHDPADVAFQSDGSLIMNYANDNCQNRFSPQQQEAMRAFLLARRANWLSAAPALPPTTETANLTLPMDGGTVDSSEPLLSWEAVPQATAYLVQVSRLNSFPPALTDNYLAGTNSLTTDTLLDNRTYFWRVRAFNGYHTCTAFSTRQSFITTAPVVGTQTIGELTQWRIMPQPLMAGQDLRLEWEMSQPWQGRLEGYNQLGQPLWSQELQLQPGDNNTIINHHIK